MVVVTLQVKFYGPEMGRWISPRANLSRVGLLERIRNDTYNRACAIGHDETADLIYAEFVRADEILFRTPRY